jgi:hypothetical protein
MGAVFLQDCIKEVVVKEMTKNNWIHSIVRLSTPVQISQYLEIWDIGHALHLIPEQPDSISWTLIANRS